MHDRGDAPPHARSPHAAVAVVGLIKLFRR